MTPKKPLVEEKSAVASIGVWGSLVSIVFVIADLVNNAAMSGALGKEGVAIVIGLGAVVSLFGRLRAKTQITSVLPQSTERT